MTCIIGLKEKGNVYLGCDSLTLCGDVGFKETCKKIIRRDNMLIGSAGSVKECDTLQRIFTIPQDDKETTPKNYMKTVFVQSLEKFFSDYKSLRAPDSIIGYKGSLFKLYSDFSIVEYTDDYVTCGSGGEIALGAMDVLVRVKHLTPEQKIKKALEVSAKYVSSVDGPFYVERL